MSAFTNAKRRLQQHIEHLIHSQARAGGAYIEAIQALSDEHERQQRMISAIN